MKVTTKKSFKEILSDMIAHGKTIKYFAADIETGGLNDETHQTDATIPVGSIGAIHYPILEISACIFNANGDHYCEPLTIVIKHTEEELDRCSEWSKNQFADTLMKECLTSEITLEEAEAMMIDLIKEHEKEGEQKMVMFGNSIRLDRDFISCQMPKLSQELNYRLADISTLKVILGGIYGEYAKFNKKAVHKAEDDIKESIAEYEYYKKTFFVSQEAFIKNNVLKSDNQFDIAKTILVNDNK